MDKRIFDGVLGISCLENYILGILKSREVDISRLYCRSLIDPQKLYKDIFIENMTYETYREIPSIHSIAKQLGLIKFIFVETNRGFDIILKLRKLSQNEYLLVRVKPEYLKEKFNIRLWRDDHYILVFMKNSEIYFINDKPLAEGVLTQKELMGAYDHGYMWIRALSPMNKEMIDNSMIQFIDLFHSLKSLNYANSISYFETDREVKTKHMLLIYRVALQRTIEFLGYYFDMSSYMQYILELNKLLAKLEYDILKKNVNICGSTDIIFFIINCNLMFYENVEKELRGV